MKGLWRRIRGALGMGLTWALGWAPIGGVVGGVLALLFAPGAPLIQVITVNATVLGLMGFAGGTLFAGLLRLAEGRRRFDELTMPRFAVWGAAGGLLLGALGVVTGLWGAGIATPVGTTVLAVSTLLGAASAAGTLAMARRADRTLPGSDEPRAIRDESGRPGLAPPA